MPRGLLCGPPSSCLHPMRMISGFTFEYAGRCLPALWLPALLVAVCLLRTSRRSSMLRDDVMALTSSLPYSPPILPHGNARRFDLHLSSPAGLSAAVEARLQGMPRFWTSQWVSSFKALMPEERQARQNHRDIYTRDT